MNYNSSKPQTAQQAKRQDSNYNAKDRAINKKNPNMSKGQIIDRQISNFEQHKAIKILQKETHLSNQEQKIFLATFLRRHVEQFREIEGDPMEFLLALTINLKYVFVPKGKVIFHEDENADNLFFILDGDVQFYTRKTEQDIQRERFWLQAVQSKQQNPYQLSNVQKQRLHKDEEVLKYYKCDEDENVFRFSKKKNVYFVDGVLLLKKTYQRNKGQSFGIDEKDNSQTAVAWTDTILAVTSQSDYIQSYTKYKEKNSFTFDCLKKLIAPLISQYPTRIDDITLRLISSKTKAINVPLHQTVFEAISEATLKEIPTLNQKSRSELGLNESVYILKQGYIEYYLNYQDSEQKGQKICQLTDGDVFGHECLFKPEKQIFTVISISPSTQIFQLKKEYLCENETLLDILQVKGEQFWKQLQSAQNKNQKPQNNLSFQAAKSEVSSINNQKVEKQFKIQKLEINNLLSKQKLKNEQLVNNYNNNGKQLQQQSENKANNNQQTNLSTGQVEKSKRQRSQSKKSQTNIPSIIELQNNQQKSKQIQTLNVPKTSSRKGSIRMHHFANFEGSFDQLDEDDQLSQSNSKLEQDLIKYKQKSKTILSAARSCTQIQVDSNDQFQSPTLHGINMDKSSQPYLAIPHRQSLTHRKSESTHVSPAKKIILVVEELNQYGEPKKVDSKAFSYLKANQKQEELKFSPNKVTSIENNIFKSQTQAKLVPCRQPDIFRIKHNMFDSSSQSNSANNGIESRNENEHSPFNQPLVSPFNAFSKDSEFLNNLQKSSLKQIRQLKVPTLNIQQSIYYSCGVINNIQRENQPYQQQQQQQPQQQQQQQYMNQYQQIFTPQSSRSSEEQSKMENSYKQQVQTPNRLPLNKQIPVNSPIKLFDQIKSPIQQNYLNFKTKYFNPLHTQRERGTTATAQKLQAN